MSTTIFSGNCQLSSLNMIIRGALKICKWDNLKEYNKNFLQVDKKYPALLFQKSVIRKFCFCKICKLKTAGAEIIRKILACKIYKYHRSIGG